MKRYNKEFFQKKGSEGGKKSRRPLDPETAKKMGSAVRVYGLHNHTATNTKGLVFRSLKSDFYRIVWTTQGTSQETFEAPADMGFVGIFNLNFNFSSRRELREAFREEFGE